MKNEKLLLSLPFPECPDVVCEKPKYTYHKKYIYQAEVFNNQVLILTVFDAKEHKPIYRVFTADNDYVSQRKDGRYWKRSTAKVFAVFDGWGSHFFSTSENETVIEEYAKKNGIERRKTGLLTVAKYLEKIGQYRADERFRRAQEAVDRVMLQIRPFPKDFTHWLNQVPFKESRYIMYQYTGKKIQKGYCTHCNNHIEVKGAKHWSKGCCPNCKSSVYYIAEGKLNLDRLRKTKTVIYVQCAKDDYITRACIVTRYYRYDAYSHELTSHNYIDEYARRFNVSKRSFEQATSERGTYFRENWSGCYITGYIYSKNIKKIAERFGAEHMKYVPWTKLFREGEYNFQYMWRAIKDFPVLESYIKRGMTRYVKEIATEYNSGCGEDGALELMNIPKTTLKILERYNMSLSEMPIYTACQAKNKEYVKEVFEWYRNSSDYYADKIKYAIQFNSYPQLIAYLKSQMRKDDTINSVLDDYKDYLEQCEELRWDMRDTKVIRAHDLYQRHEYATDQIKLMRKQINERGVKEAYYKNVFDLSYTDGKYSVILPRDTDDLKNEGDSLQHCVYSNYTSKLAEGRCIIVFIRKNDEFYKSLATAELDTEDWDCVQIRGFKNTAPDEDVKKFWNKYLKKLQKVKKLRLKQEAA